MNTLVRKAFRDLRGERGRSASIVGALALGIAGFLAVLSAYAILTRALNDGYEASNPPSATLAIDRLDAAGVRVAQAVPGVEAAEARRTVRGRIKTGPAQWRNLALFARGDFAASRIGTVEPESGSWPPGAGEVAIERDALQVARAGIGDVVIVRTEAGQERSLRISGSVHDVGQAQARMENTVYGYVTLETLTALGAEPFYDELAIRVAQRPLDEAQIREIATAVAGALESSGGRVLRIDVPEPGKHPHAELMGLLLLSMAGFGGLALALSGVIVFNVLTALLAGQTRQIGVMKALGGTRLQIARVYILEAGLLGVLAVALAVPVGLAGGRWLCRWLAVFLNFDIESYAVPLWIHALVLAVGVAVPVVAALLPVWLGTRGTVREALLPGGAPRGMHGTSAVDRALASIRGPSRVLMLAMRNAARNRTRVALTLATLVASGVFFMSALNLRQSLIGTLDRLFEAKRADLSVDLATDYPIEDVESVARGTAGVSEAEAWIVVDGELPGARDAARTRSALQRPLQVIGLPPASRLLRFDLSSGEGLGAAAPGVVVNAALFEALGRPATGSELSLRIDAENVSLRLAGVAREPFSSPVAYVSRSFFDGRHRAGTANALRIGVASPGSTSLDAVRTALEASLEREGIRALKATTMAETRLVLDQHMDMIYVFLVVVSCILGGIGAFALFTTVSLNVSERRREMGVLRAIGATPARVAQIVVIEGVTVGGLAWLIATLLAWPSGKAVGELLLGLMFRTPTGISLAIEPTGILIWLVVSLAGSALAGLWPALQASGAPVREALSYE